MLIKRLYLRNFRVYEDELDLYLPPGLVGIYGPNGSGKSTLLEAILFTLWGRARTTKDQIRSAGVGGDCVTEVEFEHEGHLYLVRRTLKGINAAVSVEAHCDGALMSTGTRDAERYVESVLGMDDGAFRASVFAEQKQLAAFSNQSPAERRRLVLQLLGITPLDAARDAARKDAREKSSDHDRLRGMLADLEALEVDAADSAAQAEASQVVASEEAGAAEVARERAQAAASAFDALDQRRQEHEALVIEGRAARQEMDLAQQAGERGRAELEELDGLATRLADLEREAADLESDEKRIALLVAAATSARRVAAIEVPDEPDTIAEADLDRAEQAAADLREQAAAATALLSAAAEEHARAGRALEQSDALSGEGTCPTCGQALGEAFETVQSHRRKELDAAAARHQELEGRASQLRKAAEQASATAAELGRRATRSRADVARWQQAVQRRADAIEASVRDWREAMAAGAGVWLHNGRTGAGLSGAGTEGASAGPDGPAKDEHGTEVPTVEQLDRAVAVGRSAIEAEKAASNAAHAIRGRLESRPRIERAVADAVAQLASASGRVDALREKVKALEFRREDLERAAEQRARALDGAAQADAAAHRAAIVAAQDRERATAAAARLADGRAQHAQLADLESEARHRSRAADLLAEFRNTVVATVGPRLALQAADLFGELTDHEYDSIDVDPDTYQLQIGDGGRLYGLDRFSGSEIDLANLALRVAISEHIHFQSGGSVGLLVLDEVFGPLDDDRKNRMLLALERLKGRFRQVLVVTHDAEIKEQLPNAIEVVKLPGRRATARIVGD